jgi:hypothetical protein
MNREITLHIILEKPTQGVDIGLQKGTGSRYETEQIQQSQGEDLYFFCPIVVKGEGTDVPRFSGVYAQGTKDEPFVYLDIGTCAGQLNTIWSRRLKIPLKSMDWSKINACLSNPNASLVAHVAGLTKDGGPNCGTVKPFLGWHIEIEDENGTVH